MALKKRDQYFKLGETVEVYYKNEWHEATVKKLVPLKVKRKRDWFSWKCEQTEVRRKPNPLAPQPNVNDRIRITHQFFSDEVFNPEYDEREWLSPGDILIVKHKDGAGDIMVNNESSPWHKDHWILKDNFHKIEMANNAPKSVSRPKTLAEQEAELMEIYYKKKAMEYSRS